jgi:AcrR family transcriptional regulator
MAASKWTKANLEKILEPYRGPHDPDSPQGRKRARILRAATDLFLAQGYRKTSVDDVARRAHVAKGTIYLYFENKGALLIAAVTAERMHLLGALEPLLTGAIPSRERLRYWLVLSLTSARDCPLTTRLLNGDAELEAALEDVGEGMTRRQEEGREWIVELIELAAPGSLDAEEKRARADVLMGLGYFAGKMMQERVRAGRSLDEFAGTLVDLLIDGLVSRKKKRGKGGR